jgi:hypothetical protein
VGGGELEEEDGVFLGEGGGEVARYWVELRGDSGAAAFERGPGFVG